MWRSMRPSCLNAVHGADEKRNEVYINTASEHRSRQHSNASEASTELSALPASRLMRQEGCSG